MEQMEHLNNESPYSSNDKAPLIYLRCENVDIFSDRVSSTLKTCDEDDKGTNTRKGEDVCESDSKESDISNYYLSQNIKSCSQRDENSLTKRIGQRMSPPLDDVDGAMFSRTHPELDDVDGPMFSRTRPELDDVDGPMFSRTRPELDDVDGPMFSRTRPELDDVDGAMFSRTHPELDDVDGPMFSRTRPELDDVDGAMFSRNRPGLDDVDGPMFSRTRSELDDVDGAMFSRKRQVSGNKIHKPKQGIDSFSRLSNSSHRSSWASFDYSDGVMFSRSPVSTKRPTRITINSYKNDTDIPKSPSVDCFKSPAFPITFGDFPTRQSVSASDLLKNKRRLSDLTDFGPGEIPPSFDLPDSPVSKVFNHNHSNRTSVNNVYIKSDMADGALFNRVNSLKNKEYNRKDRIGNMELFSIIEVWKKLRPWKSLQDVPSSLNENESNTSVRDRVITSRVWHSLPDRLDSKVRSDLQSHMLSNYEELNTPVVEEPIKKEVFHPLGRNRMSVRSHLQGGEDEALQGPQLVDCSRKPLKLRHLCTVAFPSVSVLLFLADIGTDINLAHRYKQQGDSVFFWVTLMCILVPSILMSIVDLSWIYRDEVENTKTSWNQTRCWKVTRVILGLLSLGRVVRTVSHIYHSIRSKLYECDKVLHKNRKIEERRDYCMLDVINAFTESCPQLIAQMFLLYQYRRPFSADLCLSILLSWLSIGWAYSCYYRYQKEATRGRNEVKLFGIIVFCFAVLSSLATRICCISLFLVYYPIWIGVLVLSSHFFIMFIWITFCQKPKLEGLTTSRWGQCLYYLFFAYLSTMYFVNLREGKSRFRLLTYFTIYYAENCLATGLLLWKTSFDIRKSVVEFRWSLLIVPLGMVMHILLLTLFYKCFHPPPRDITRNGSSANVV